MYKANKGVVVVVVVRQAMGMFVQVATPLACKCIFMKKGDGQVTHKNLSMWHISKKNIHAQNTTTEQKLSHREKNSVINC